jgi:hypothetical protein
MRQWVIKQYKTYKIRPLSVFNYIQACINTTIFPIFAWKKKAKNHRISQMRKAPLLQENRRLVRLLQTCSNLPDRLALNITVITSWITAINLNQINLPSVNTAQQLIRVYLRCLWILTESRSPIFRYIEGFRRVRNECLTFKLFSFNIRSNTIHLLAY